MKKFILQRILLNCVVLIWAAGFCANAKADEYLGASGVLQQVEIRNSKPASKPTDEQSKLRDDLKAFSESVSNLPPGDAAKQWLEFVDRAVKIQRQAGGDYDPSFRQITTVDLLNALPPPAAWNDLAQAIGTRPPPGQDAEQMREIGLRLLAATLTGNIQGRNTEITNLEARANEADSQTAYIYGELLQQLSRAMLATSGDPDAALKSLEQQMNSGGEGSMLQVPNLVAEVGADKAEAFIRKALVAPNVILMFDQPNETSRLAQKLALELVDQLKTPQWGLVNSLDAVGLYEAMDKRFSTGTNNSTTLPGLPPGMNFIQSGSMDNGLKGVAQIYYMLGLISEGRTQEAVAVAKQCKGNQDYQFDNAFEAMDRAGYAAELDDFLYQLLSQNPSLPFWRRYVEFAAKGGQTDRMLTLVRATLARGDLSESKKTALHQILFSALLAADDVDEGVREMRRLIATNDFPQQPGEYNYNAGYNAGQLGVMLARIGILMKNPEWTQEGIVAATNWLATSTGQNMPNWESAGIISSLAQILWELNRGPEAESVLADALAKATRPGNSQHYGWNEDGSPPRILSSLAVLYYKAGRYDDVLDLLQNSPDWNAKDLSDLFGSNPWDDQFSINSLHTGSSSLSLPYVAASALAAKGRTEEAQRITDALLNNDPALDRGYELLISLNGTNAIPRLNELFKGDQFQTRPLIWKAHLLRQENQLDEAEKMVRQAIAIDPSDGEEGRGDRMRAYAELSDILEARGEKKDADSYREIVKAIRISEDADQFYTAGLLKRAIAMYKKGLDHFADAYCIQSRLAIQLAAIGKNKEAEEHYRRAYELMPDSFGRVESHCFGCERVFEGEQAQSIAEKVFTQLAVERPDKPQVFYLLGYLHTEEDNYSEAWTNFQTAARMDPDYLNAWVKMQEVSQHIMLSPTAKDEIAFNILRLDPLQRHCQANFASVSDLTRLWNAVTVAMQYQPKPASNLFPLTASKIAMEKNRNSSDDQSARIEEMMEAEGIAQNLSPAHAVAQTPFVALAGELIFGNGISSMGE